MNKNKIKLKSKLYYLGENIGLGISEVDDAKKTAKTIIGFFIVAGIFSLIGMFSSRLESAGLWYTSVSIKDFGILSNFL